MRKYEVALMLAKRFEYTSYLEICTAMTGGTFAQVDKDQFSRRARLMYRCPPEFSDGEPSEFCTHSESSEELLCEVMRSGERFDLVFIDPWHTYTNSLRDIVFGLRLIKDGGVVLIHDCSPPNATCAEPDFHAGEWSGVTFAAYLDLVLFDRSIRYVTVDCDYGCGIICKRNRLAGLSGECADHELASRWRSLEPSQKYAFLDEHRSRLLRLITTNEFTRLLAGDSLSQREDSAER